MLFSWIVGRTNLLAFPLRRAKKLLFEVVANLMNMIWNGWFSYLFVNSFICLFNHPFAIYQYVAFEDVPKKKKEAQNITEKEVQKIEAGDSSIVQHYFLVNIFYTNRLNSILFTGTPSIFSLCNILVKDVDIVSTNRAFFSGCTTSYGCGNFDVRAFVKVAPRRCVRRVPWESTSALAQMWWTLIIHPHTFWHPFIHTTYWALSLLMRVLLSLSYFLERICSYVHTCYLYRHI